MRERVERVSESEYVVGTARKTTLAIRRARWIFGRQEVRHLPDEEVSNHYLQALKIGETYSIMLARCLDEWAKSSPNAANAWAQDNDHRLVSMGEPERLASWRLRMEPRRP